MKKKWWHKKVAYQIYPKSFQDTNGDGVGDIPGIIDRLDYLKELGVDIIWLSPVYASPMVDQGYDISDYYGINPLFGTMEDMERLIEEIRKRDMYLIMDLVVNHCSSEHSWFKKALKDPDGEYGKRFIIKDSVDGRVPNNWRSEFGGSVWEKIPGFPGKYYLHTFAKEQPDLNWENKTVREAVYKMVNWWLDKGISGFRIDAIIYIKKDLTFASRTPDKEDGTCYVADMIKDADGIDVFLNELKETCFKPHDAFTVGEVFFVGKEKLIEFAGDDGYFSTLFSFEHCSTTEKGNYWYEFEEFEFKKWREAVFTHKQFVDGVSYESNIIENHDQSRGASYFIPREDYGYSSVTALGGLMVLLNGLPFLYQGQEIGMKNCPFASIDEYNDVNTINHYQAAIEAGVSREKALASCWQYSRDNARTPMQWNDGLNAGFSTGTPWMKLNPCYQEINVERQQKEEKSVLHFYQRLLKLRKQEEWAELWAYGSFSPAYREIDTIFAYYRALSDSSQRVLVISNFSAHEVQMERREEWKQVLLSNNGPELSMKNTAVTLEPYAFYVIECV